MLFTLFVVLPIGEAAWYSAFNWNGFGRPTNWIGLDNYRFVLETRAFWLALRNNGLIIAASLLIQLPLALALALLLAERFRGAVALRMLFFLPYILAEIATGLIFSFVYDGDYRLVASIWRAFGAEAPHLLASTDTAMLAVLIVIVWKYFGFHMMLFIAALQGMDKSLIEAASIDGATRPQVLRHVVIPLLYPTIRLCVLRHHRVAATVRPRDAADARRAGGFVEHAGELPLQQRHRADAGRLRQRHRRDPVRDLRHLRLHLQAMVHAR
jgi:raffinose/stachyose/melibiose transport system permease protein